MNTLRVPRLARAVVFFCFSVPFGTTAQPSNDCTVEFARMKSQAFEAAPTSLASEKIQEIRRRYPALNDFIGEDETRLIALVDRLEKNGVPQEKIQAKLSGGAQCPR